MPKNDPSQAYDLIVSDRPPDWWTCTCNGIPQHRFAPDRRDLADHYLRDPEYRLALVTRFIHDKGQLNELTGLRAKVLPQQMLRRSAPLPLQTGERSPGW